MNLSRVLLRQLCKSHFVMLNKAITKYLCKSEPQNWNRQKTTALLNLWKICKPPSVLSPFFSDHENYSYSITTYWRSSACLSFFHITAIQLLGDFPCADFGTRSYHSVPGGRFSNSSVLRGFFLQPGISNGSYSKPVNIYFSTFTPFLSGTHCPPLGFSCYHFIGYFLNFNFTNNTLIQTTNEHMQLAISLSCNTSSSLPRLILKV